MNSEADWDAIHTYVSKTIAPLLYQEQRKYAVLAGYDLKSAIEDWTQEATVEIVHSWAGFSGRHGCSRQGWMYTIVRNIVVKRIYRLVRDQQRTRRCEEEDEFGVAPQANPESAYLQAENEQFNIFLMSIIQEILERWAIQGSPREAEDALLIQLSYLEESSPDDICRLLGITAGAFRTRKTRIIQRLERELLANELVREWFEAGNSRNTIFSVLLMVLV
jgi:RNA polymerase sigma factor (sigma-70 family)